MSSPRLTQQSMSLTAGAGVAILEDARCEVKADEAEGWEKGLAGG
eukprot:CAMPEP_0173459502 /NCGR_PEP_ID=MMETSP1357-20121228/61482_1 /TAXON_ID=77926 /ORGANISM="Hemiselmis rufescens, Strain PCC563" /LENGTH=44 /DNA_ID= /DNA_START= /DNA_END= /DNA_ORIENTATION=